MAEVIHPIRFYRWAMDAGWHDTWYVLAYPFKTWRCRLFGHKWGPEQNDYEPNTYTLMESWRECQRPGCEGWWETYSVFGARGKVG